MEVAELAQLCQTTPLTSSRDAPSDCRELGFPRHVDAVTLGIDLGGTYCKLALVEGARLLAIQQMPTRRDRSAEDVLSEIADMAGAIISKARSQGRSVVGVGVGMPGVIDRGSRTLHYSRHLGWRDVPVGYCLEKELGIRTVVEHDAYLSGLAEFTVGAAEGEDYVLWITIGTGIGSAMFHRGGSWRGASHLAGELGQCLIDGLTLESISSADAIGSEYTAVSDQAADAFQIAQRLDSDPIATYVWDRAIRPLATTLVNAVCLLDPSMVVIGGGLGEAGDLLLEPLRDRMCREMPPYRSVPPVVSAAIGSHAGSLGAGLFALQEIRLNSQKPCFDK